MDEIALHLSLGPFVIGLSADRADVHQTVSGLIRNVKYDRQVRAQREGNAEEAEKTKLIKRQNQLRAQEIGNVDVKFQNGDLRDLILSMQSEARLLGLILKENVNNQRTGGISSRM